jgi:hypothetical protein
MRYHYYVADDLGALVREASEIAYTFDFVLTCKTVKDVLARLDPKVQSHGGRYVLTWARDDEDGGEGADGEDSDAGYGTRDAAVLAAKAWIAEAKKERRRMISEATVIRFRDARDAELFAEEYVDPDDVIGVIGGKLVIGLPIRDVEPLCLHYLMED